MLKMTLNIKGRVQKVGYRYSVVNFVIESGLGLTGHVRNLSDGSVEVVAEGSLEELKELHRFCLQGPPTSQVREIDQDLAPIHSRSFTEFRILT